MSCSSYNTVPNEELVMKTFMADSTLAVELPKMRKKVIQANDPVSSPAGSREGEDDSQTALMRNCRDTTFAKGVELCKLPYSL